MRNLKRQMAAFTEEFEGRVMDNPLWWSGGTFLAGFVAGFIILSH